jgi:uncharacterized membrane protein
MTGWLFWIAITIAEALVFYFAAMWYLPRLVGRFSANKMRAFAGRLNAIGYRGLPMAGRRALTTNPDMVTAFGVFDLSHGPVRIACALPPWDSYWSVSLYGWNTDCFCVINDRTAVADRFDLVIVRGRNAYQCRKSEVLAVSPSKRGIIVVRMVALDRDDPQELARIETVVRQTAVTVRPSSASTIASESEPATPPERRTGTRLGTRA